MIQKYFDLFINALNEKKHELWNKCAGGYDEFDSAAKCLQQLWDEGALKEDVSPKMLAIFHMEDSGPFKLVSVAVDSADPKKVVQAFQDQCEIKISSGTEILIINGSTEVVDQFFLEVE